MDEYNVYVKVDDKGRITAINSDAFLSALDGWIQIDSGNGDRFHHAQGNYLDKPLFEDRGLHRYKLQGDKVIERAEDEISADYVPPIPQPTDKERITALEEELKAAKILLGLEE